MGTDTITIIDERARAEPVGVPLRHFAAGFLFCATLAGAGLCLPPVADLLVRWAENSSHATVREGTVYDAAIVLTGGTPGVRLGEGIAVVRRGQARHLLVSGVFDEPQEARIMAEIHAGGLSSGQVTLESRSRNTRANAVESARIIAARNWRTLLLITSAAHVERASRCFHKLGLSPDILPVDFRSRTRCPGRWLPSGCALARSGDALHELTGRVAYALLGYAG